MTSINGASNIDFANIPLAKTYSDADIQGIEGVDYIVDGEITFEDDDISYTEPKRNNYPSSASVNSAQNIVQNNSNNLADIPLAKTYSDEEISNATQGEGYYLIDENGKETFIKEEPPQSVILTTKKSTPTSSNETPTLVVNEEKPVFDNVKTTVSVKIDTNEKIKTTLKASADVSENTNVSLNYVNENENWKIGKDEKQTLSVNANTKLTDTVSINSEVGTVYKGEDRSSSPFVAVGGKWIPNEHITVETKAKISQGSNANLSGKVTWDSGTGVNASASGDTNGKIGLKASAKTPVNEDGTMSVTSAIQFKDENSDPNNEELTTSVTGDYKINDNFSTQLQGGTVYNTENSLTKPFIKSSITYKEGDFSTTAKVKDTDGDVHSSIEGKWTLPDGLSTSIKAENDENNDFKATAGFVYKF